MILTSENPKINNDLLICRIKKGIGSLTKHIQKQILRSWKKENMN